MTTDSTSIADILGAYAAVHPGADTREKLILAQQFAALLKAGWTPEQVSGMAGAYAATGGSDAGSFARWAEQRRRRINAWWLTD